MSVQLRSEHLLCHHPAVLSTNVGEEVALMSIERGRYYSLNTTAAAVWRFISQPVSLSALQSAMRNAFEDDSARIDGDISQLIHHLIGEGLVTLREA